MLLNSGLVSGNTKGESGTAPYDDVFWWNSTLTGNDDVNSAYTNPFNTGQYCDILYQQDFRFNLPVGEGGTIITGIEVRVDKWKTAGNCVDEIIQLAFSTNTGRVGTNKADKVTAWPGAQATFIYGGPDDLWGFGPIAVEQINSEWLALQLVTKATSDSTVARVDYMALTVYYHVIAGESFIPRTIRSNKRYPLSIFGDVGNLLCDWRYDTDPISLPLTIGDEYDDIVATNTNAMVYPFTDAGAVTISIASPGVVNKVGHGLADTREIWLKTSGALPTGLTQYTHYYVKYKDADNFWLATTSGGTSINTSGSQSGTHNIWTKDP